MRTVIAGLVVAAALALAAPAGARPIDSGGPSPSAPTPAPTPSAAAPSGTETWIVFASSALAFVLGAGAARVAPVARLRVPTP